MFGCAYSIHYTEYMFRISHFVTVFVMLTCTVWTCPTVSDKIFCCLVAEVFVLSDFSRSARNDSRKRSSCELRPHTCNLSTQSLSNVKHLKPYLAKNEALQIEENWEFIHSKCCKLTLNYTYLISSPWLKKILKFIPSKCFILPLKKVRDFFTQG